MSFFYLLRLIRWKHAMYNPHNQTKKETNQPKVGFELEFSGLSLGEVASIITKQYGGTVHSMHKNLLNIKETELGNFIVELDAKLLKDLAKASKKNKEENNLDINGVIEKILSKTLENAVPVEVVYPPVSISKIDKCDELVTLLRKQGAMGTKNKFIAGFGLHINPEITNINVETILAYIQSFILLEPWLRKRINVDFTRMMSPFIQSYKRGYKKLVLSKDYNPSMLQLIKDYIYYNPTRNCALDMLPLFCYINKAYVQREISLKSIKERPTFHYRLPNCDINNKDWSISKEWHFWTIIEKLAFNQDLRYKMTKEYLTWHSILSDPINLEWIKKTEVFLEKL